jgi:predicted AlkP superfamily phosphohydrolase/phosphomutase
MVETLSRVVPERIQRVVPWEEGVKHDRVLSIIDWDETEVVASNQGPIYLAREPDDPGYEPLRDELIESLEALRHPATGEPIVKAVYRGEEYYEGPYAGNAPDLILDQGQNVHTSDAVGPDEWLSDTGVWVGGNMPEGIFLFSGPSFESTGLGERARITDLAPTLLHAMGSAVPTDLDGEVLDVFDPESEPGRRAVEPRPPIVVDRGAEEADDREVEERLADLGYLE